jgi:hypothetical protein
MGMFDELICESFSLSNLRAVEKHPHQWGYRYSIVNAYHVTRQFGAGVR